MLGPAIRAVVLDVGECLVDETRRYAAWADRLGVSPPHTFSAVLGAVLAGGGGFDEACAVIRPGFRIGGLLELSGPILNTNTNANADAGTGEGGGEA